MLLEKINKPSDIKTFTAVINQFCLLTIIKYN